MKILAWFTLIIFMSSGAMAQRNPPPQVPPGQRSNSAKGILNMVFTAAERSIITRVLGTPPPRTESSGRKRKKGKKGKRGLPPGLAKRGGQLPPGLAKRGGRLPPGLAKRQLPRNALDELGPARRGTERVIVGADVLLVDIATDIVLDVIQGVVRNAGR